MNSKLIDQAITSGMTSLENLCAEYKKEKNSDIKIRMLVIPLSKYTKNAEKAPGLLRCSCNYARRECHS